MISRFDSQEGNIAIVACWCSWFASVDSYIEETNGVNDIEKNIYFIIFIFIFLKLEINVCGGYVFGKKELFLTEDKGDKHPIKRCQGCADTMVY